MTDQALLRLRFAPPFAALLAHKFVVIVDSVGGGRRIHFLTESLDSARAFCQDVAKLNPKLWQRPRSGSAWLERTIT